ncbi:MAG TPA: 30S ribosomal protein S12 methylthiotransferase RimO [Syntrophorhabdaceae bacterium]|nr:30S ribosomal protein S12 methylthiotransferase RimO [Syntrophorhabdaceae bacterium]
MKFKVISLGCPKNLVESEYLAKAFESAGHTLSENECDTVVVNTCAFISDAVKESIETVLQAASEKTNVVVTGCLVERYGDQLKSLLPEVRLFLGRGAYPDAGPLLDQIGFHKPSSRFAETFPRKMLTAPPVAYLKIQEGCNNRCSYCTIPMIRGPLSSRTIADVEKEFQFLLENGYREINIIGQDITAYGKDQGASLQVLLRSLLKVKGDYYVRLLYMHPAGLDPEIIDMVCGEEKIIPYFDVPIQHSEDRILNAMNRRHSKSDLERLLISIREKDPGAILRTSLIVGFPGETDDEFHGLSEFVRKWEFDMLGVFMYSREEKTPAFKMKPQIRKSIKKTRFNTIMEMQKDISRKRLSRLTGKQMKVIVENKEPASITGRLLIQAPDIDGIAFIQGECAVGEIREGKIVKTLDYDVIVEI